MQIKLANRIKKSQSKRKIKKFGSNDKVIRIALVAVIIAFVFIIYQIFNAIVSSQTKINLSGESYYQYFAGIKQEYSGSMDVQQINDDIKLVLEGGKTVYLDSTPMYYTDVLGKALIPAQVELVMPTGEIYKLDKFTNIIRENYTSKIKKFNKNNQEEVNGSFLYDGNDMYFFLETTTITIGANQYVVSPLSYAIVNYRTSIEIYDYEKNDYITINDDESLKFDVLATGISNKYSINMSIDSLSTSKGEQLLIKSINDLKEYKY